MTHGVIWNNKIQPKQGQHVAYQLAIKISTRVKSKQFYHSVQDDAWTKGATYGEPKIGLSPVHP